MEGSVFSGKLVCTRADFGEGQSLINAVFKLVSLFSSKHVRTIGPHLLSLLLMLVNDGTISDPNTALAHKYIVDPSG